MSSFEVQKKSHLQRNIFFDGAVDIARYDHVKYPSIDKLTQRQLGYFWRPEEVALDRDTRDFKLLTPFEKHIFISNLQRQILLDSVQGRSPAICFLPIVSLPEVESFIVAWTFFEQIHSRSYTHIIRNVYNNPSEIFDKMLDIKEIVDCSKDISKYYGELTRVSSSPFDNFFCKKALWLCLNAVNALEGIRFYTSFACSWAFAELNKMEGNAKIIKLIARDENLHLAFTQQLLKTLPKEDPDFLKIKESTKVEVAEIFESIINQEKSWAKYLFKDGSIIGLNESLLCSYIDWLSDKRMAAIGIASNLDVGSNPLPWTQKWIAGADVQMALQETENTQYITAGVKQDLNEDILGALTL